MAISNQGIRDNQEQGSKKVYQMPELTIYGSIVGLTHNNKQKGNFDNGFRTRKT